MNWTSEVMFIIATVVNATLWNVINLAISLECRSICDKRRWDKQTTGWIEISILWLDHVSAIPPPPLSPHSMGFIVNLCLYIQSCFPGDHLVTRQRTNLWPIREQTSIVRHFEALRWHAPVVCEWVICSFMQGGKNVVAVQLTWRPRGLPVVHSGKTRWKSARRGQWKKNHQSLFFYEINKHLDEYTANSELIIEQSILQKKTHFNNQNWPQTIEQVKSIRIIEWRATEIEEKKNPSRTFNEASQTIENSLKSIAIDWAPFDFRSGLSERERAQNDVPSNTHGRFDRRHVCDMNSARTQALTPHRHYIMSVIQWSPSSSSLSPIGTSSLRRHRSSDRINFH